MNRAPRDTMRPHELPDLMCKICPNGEASLLTQRGRRWSELVTKDSLDNEAQYDVDRLSSRLVSNTHHLQCH